MSGRDIHEPHRVSTTLELLFDLTFVVAIAASAAQLHHAVVAGHLAQGLLGFTFGFASIWWAWMGHTWFASAYDTDDTWYRIMVMIQMAGVLILAAGLPKAAHGDFSVGVVGYVVMRLGLVALWLRAAREHPERRRTCLRYAIGIFVLQLLWIARLWAPPAWYVPGFLAIGVLELIVPIWAQKVGGIPWHAHHIAERYGLFTIIVLGECVLGATNSIAAVIDNSGWTVDVALVGFGMTILVFSLWWVYFLVPSGASLDAHRDRVLGWAYWHLLIFFSLAALGAFLEVLADQLKPLTSSAAGHAQAAHQVSPTLAIALVVAAVMVFLMTVAWISARVTKHQVRLAWMFVPCFAVLAAVVAAVALGLRVSVAIPLVTLGPVLLIFIVQRELVKRPETFRIQ
jgi:low temperature requirement protein LtrA